MGQAPGRVPVPAGQHALELRAEGYETVRRAIELASGETVTVTVRMARLSDFRGVDPGFFLMSGVAGLLSLGVGVGVGVHAMALSSDAAACAGTPGCALDASARRQEIRDVALAADLLYGAAGLLGVGALVLALVTDWSRAEVGATRAGLHWRPAAGPDALGLEAQGWF